MVGWDWNGWGFCGGRERGNGYVLLRLSHLFADLVRFRAVTAWAHGTCVGGWVGNAWGSVGKVFARDDNGVVGGMGDGGSRVVLVWRLLWHSG